MFVPSLSYSASSPSPLCFSLFFFFNDTATTEIYTLSLHDALPIYRFLDAGPGAQHHARDQPSHRMYGQPRRTRWDRSEEHTSELQSHLNLVCRLLLEKKKKKMTTYAGRIGDKCRNARRTLRGQTVA